MSEGMSIAPEGAQEYSYNNEAQNSEKLNEHEKANSLVMEKIVNQFPEVVKPITTESGEKAAILINDEHYLYPESDMKNGILVTENKGLFVFEFRPTSDIETSKKDLLEKMVTGIESSKEGSNIAENEPTKWVNFNDRNHRMSVMKIPYNKKNNEWLKTTLTSKATKKESGNTEPSNIEAMTAGF